VAKDVDLILVWARRTARIPTPWVEVAQRSGVKAQLIHSAKDFVRVTALPAVKPRAKRVRASQCPWPSRSIAL